MIAGYTELLRRRLSAADRDAALDGIERAIRRADALCADALAGRTPSSASQTLAPISMSSCSPSTSRLTSAPQPAAPSTSPPRRSRWVLGDEEALARALGNLVDNAAKYSLAGRRSKYASPRRN